MMNFASNIKNIKKLIAILSGKESDVNITYKGLNFGVTKPWNIRCDSREINHETHDGAAEEFFLILKKELKEKISFTERQAAEYKKTLGTLEN
jgi:hypothetical protein